MGRRNGCGAGGLRVVKLVQYEVCGVAMAVGGVQYTGEKLESRASEWWWGISTFLFLREQITCPKSRLGSGAPENRCAPPRRYPQIILHTPSAGLSLA